jgi:alpha-tubulin suppressor-like RCC1 family protein
MNTDQNLVLFCLLAAVLWGSAAPSDAQGTVARIAAGGGDSLWVESDGSLWGTDSHAPERIPTTGLVTAIAAALNHSFFIQSDGSLWAMGNNYEGDLGNGTSADSHAPALILSSNVAAFFAGNHHTLLLKTNGSLWGMGDDNNGELDGPANNITSWRCCNLSSWIRRDPTASKTVKGNFPPKSSKN